MAEYPIAEVKARFARFVRDAEEGRSVLITRHGRPVAALVPADDLAQLKRLRAAQSTGLASLAGGWEGSDELVNAAREVRQRARREAEKRR